MWQKVSLLSLSKVSKTFLTLIIFISIIILISIAILLRILFNSYKMIVTTVSAWSTIVTWLLILLTASKLRYSIISNTSRTTFYRLTFIIEENRVLLNLLITFSIEQSLNRVFSLLLLLRSLLMLRFYRSLAGWYLLILFIIDHLISSSFTAWL